jgi:undecaprenyl-diphosphatase
MMDPLAWQEFDEHWVGRLSLLEGKPRRRRLAILFAHSGDSWFWLAGLGFAWLTGPETWKTPLARTIGAILLLAMIVLAIKFSFKRARPEGDWGAIYRSTDPHSFPSGHAARAFALVVLAFGWGPIWGGLILAIWAPLVSLARIAMRLHYPSDVLAGAGLGLLYGAVLILLFP